LVIKDCLREGGKEDKYLLTCEFGEELLKKKEEEEGGTLWYQVRDKLGDR
jgi:hypothetical protein